MEKLELKHLAPYLPYGLKVQYQGITNLKELSEHNKKEPKGYNVLDEDYISWVKSAPKEIIGTRISTIKRIHFYKTHIRLYVGKRHGYLKLVWFDNIKPILRHLSDLTKEIEHNGERFVPIDFINGEFASKIPSKIEWNQSVKNQNLHFVLTEWVSPEYLYGLFELLFKWHFDVFGLIDKGLAIDINTTK